MRDVLKADRGTMLVIAGLGAPAWDITAVGDCPENLPLWGGMGGACAIGLGLALAQPSRQVLVITGDGEMLMGLGTLATIAVKRPPNLAILVQDNEHYGETGMQETHTKHGVDLVAIAKGAGFMPYHAGDGAGAGAGAAGGDPRGRVRRCSRSPRSMPRRCRWCCRRGRDRVAAGADAGGGDGAGGASSDVTGAGRVLDPIKGRGP